MILEGLIRLLALVGGGLLIAIFLGLGGKACAQDYQQHDWITGNPDYQTPYGEHCCGPSHCRPAVPGEMVREEDAWLHKPTGTRLYDNQKGIYESQESRPFVCATTYLRCYFPETGI